MVGVPRNKRLTGVSNALRGDFWRPAFPNFGMLMLGLTFASLLVVLFTVLLDVAVVDVAGVEFGIFRSLLPMNACCLFSLRNPLNFGGDMFTLNDMLCLRGSC